MSIFIENIVYEKKINEIKDMINDAEIGFISTAGTVSKKGNTAFNTFIRSLKDRLYKEENDVKQSTVWDKIKRAKQNV